MALTTVNSGGIKDDSIVNADIKSDAAIAKSKLASLNITNADLDANAAIAFSKLASLPAQLTGSTNNTVCTVTGANAIAGEANLTFDGTTLNIDGNESSTTQFSGLDALRIHNANGAAHNVTADIYLTAGTGTTNRGAAIGAQFTSAASGNDLYFATNGGNVSSTNTLTERLRITSSGKVFIGSTSDYGPNAYNLANAGLSITAAGENVLRVLDSTAYAANVGGAILLGGNYRSTGDTQPFVELKSFKENATDGNYAYGFSIGTTPNGGSIEERLRIDSSGKVGIGCSPANVLHSVGTTRINQSSTLGHATNAGTMLEVRGNSIGTNGVDDDYFKGFKIALNDQTEWGSQAQFAVGRWENNSNNARSSLTISLGHGQSNSSTDADTDVLLLKSNGSVTIKDGDLVFATSGHGIDFSATSNGNGAVTSELLESYEEGTWTATLRSYQGTAWVDASYDTAPTTNIATYTQIGRFVHFSLRLNGFQTNTQNPRYAAITGLPFSCVNNQGSAVINYSTNAFNTDVQVSAHISGTTIEIYYGSNWNTWKDSASASIYLSGVYMS